MRHLVSIAAALDSVARHHEPRLVVIAALICFLSCYTAITFIARAGKPGPTSSDPWLTGAAAVTGCGFWTANFVALLAFEPAQRVGFDSGSALLAAAIGIVCSGLGFAAMVRRRMAFGGAFLGAAAAVMNCTILASLHLPAGQHPDGFYVVASLLLGVGLGSLSMLPLRRRLRTGGVLVSALLLTAAALGAHFAAMAALTLTPDPLMTIAVQTIPPVWISIAVTAICILIVAIGVTGSLVSKRIVELETAKSRLEETGERLKHAADSAVTADETKSQFLANMSHELRTPLNAILGFSELLKNPDLGTPDPARVRSYAMNIFDSGTHLLALINDILDLSRFDAGHLELNEETLDVGALVASSVHLMEPVARKVRVRLECAVPHDVPRLHADERRVRQILLNLLSNALKFTAEGGRVTVGVSWSCDGVAIAISDTGIGMTAEQIPVALERFGQIDSKLSRRHTGTGLGLPLCKHLIELHGGRLEIASKVGVGTTMTVVFPPGRILRERQAA